MKQSYAGLIALLRKRKPAHLFMLLAVADTLQLALMRALVWLGLAEFRRTEFLGMFLMVLACALFTWVLSRIDFGDRT